MIQTLEGRWQTRLFMLVVVGVPLTLLFAIWFHDYATPFALLGLVLGLGLFWDTLYNALQRRRWNHDWPPLFGLIAGVVEGVVLWLLVVAATWLVGVMLPLALWQFSAHYSTVLLAIWLLTPVLMPILFPHWRFRGGRWR